jgi:DNA-binding CsgD family transcriptional regulator
MAFHVTRGRPAPHGNTGRRNELGLTAAEARVARLLVDGVPAKEISSKVGVTESAVRGHITRIYKRWRVRNRVEAIAHVQRAAQLPPLSAAIKDPT